MLFDVLILYYSAYRLTEMRSSKQRLSRQLREREEELEDNKHRIENFRLELRKSEKAKREVDPSSNVTIKNPPPKKKKKTLL